MSKKNIIIIALVAIVGLWVFSSYNGLVGQEENVENAWAKVEAQYQRRLDLIPNIYNSAKKYIELESDALERIVAARSRATQVTIDPTNATPEQLAEFQRAQGEVGQALGRLLAITENYPDLKTNEGFNDLRVELEGTENRIAVARNEFNDAARNFNVSVRRFPGNIIASFFGFEKKPYFKADEGAEKAPVID